MSESIKIGIVLLSPSRAPVPSTRIAILNLLPLLRGAGFDPVILHDPVASDERPDPGLSAARLAAEGFRAVLFQKVTGPAVERLAGELRGAGVATVFMVCDLIEPRMVAACDATAIVTAHLRSLYPRDLQAKMSVVHDGIEEPDRVVRRYREDSGSTADPLRAVLVTSSHVSRLPTIGIVPHWLQVRVIGHYPPAPSTYAAWRNVEWRARHAGGWREGAETLYFALSRRVRRIQWTPGGVYDELEAADIGILPIDNREPGAPGKPAGWTVKSENRLTLLMSMGLPVIATPIPSYLDVASSGENAYLAETREQWNEALRRLRDPETRRRIGRAARDSVSVRFSMARQCALLVDVLRSVIDRRGRRDAVATGGQGEVDRRAR